MELKIYLVKNRISVTDFCKVLGCSRMHLNDIVNDKRKCGKSLAQLIEIKTNGQVTAAELLKGNQDG